MKKEKRLFISFLHPNHGSKQLLLRALLSWKRINFWSLSRCYALLDYKRHASTFRNILIILCFACLLTNYFLIIHSNEGSKRRRQGHWCLCKLQNFLNYLTLHCNSRVKRKYYTYLHYPTRKWILRLWPGTNSSLYKNSMPRCSVLFSCWISGQRIYDNELVDMLGMKLILILRSYKC